MFKIVLQQYRMLLRTCWIKQCLLTAVFLFLCSALSSAAALPLNVTLQNALSGELLPSQIVELKEVLADGSYSGIATATTDASGLVSFDVLDTKQYVLTATVYNGYTVTSDLVTSPGDFLFSVGTLEVFLLNSSVVPSEPFINTITNIYELLPDGSKKHYASLTTNANGSLQLDLPGLNQGKNYVISVNSTVDGWTYVTDVISQTGAITFTLGNLPLDVELLNSSVSPVAPFANKEFAIYKVLADGSNQHLRNATTDASGKVTLDLPGLGQGTNYKFSVSSSVDGWTYATPEITQTGVVSFTLGNLPLDVELLNSSVSPVAPFANKEFAIYKVLADGSNQHLRNATTDANGKVTLDLPGLGQGTNYKFSVSSSVDGWTYATPEITQTGTVSFTLGNLPLDVELLNSSVSPVVPFANKEFAIYKVLADGSNQHLRNATTDANGQITLDLPGLGQGTNYVFSVSSTVDGWQYLTEIVTQTGAVSFTLGNLPLDVELLNSSVSPIAPFANTQFSVYTVLADGSKQHFRNATTDANGKAVLDLPGLGQGTNYKIMVLSTVDGSYKYTDVITQTGTITFTLGNLPLSVTLRNAHTGMLLPNVVVSIGEVLADETIQWIRSINTDANGQIVLDLSGLGSGRNYTVAATAYNAFKAQSQIFTIPGDYQFNVGKLEVTVLSGSVQPPHPLPLTPVRVHEILADGSHQYFAEVTTDAQGILRIDPPDLGSGKTYQLKALSTITGEWKYSQPITQVGLLEFLVGNLPTSVTVRNAQSGQVLSGLAVDAFQVLSDGTHIPASVQTTDDFGVVHFDLDGLGSGSNYIFRCLPYNSGKVYSEVINTSGAVDFRVGKVPVNLYDTSTLTPIANQEIFAYVVAPGGELFSISSGFSNVNGTVYFDPDGLNQNLFFVFKVKNPFGNSKQYYSQLISGEGIVDFPIAVDVDSPLDTTLVDNTLPKFNYPFATNLDSEVSLYDPVAIDITPEITLEVGNPVRSRRLPGATVNVVITNTGTQTYQAPLRLVIENLSTGVAVGDNDGETIDGNAYIDLSRYVGDTLEPGESTGSFTLDIIAGGIRNFTFNPKVYSLRERGPNDVGLPLVNDVNGTDQWLAQGTWSFTQAHTPWESRSGLFHLDNNSQEFDLNGNSSGQLATLNGFVTIPVDSVMPTLSYWYQLKLTGATDAYHVEIQEKGTGSWSKLKSYSQNQNHTTFTREEISLEAYKGKEIRIRFSQKNESSFGVRLWTIDDLRIDDFSAEDFDYPYINNFDYVSSVHDDVLDTDKSNDMNGQTDFNVQGLWTFTGAHNGWENHSGQFHLDNNVGEIDLNGYKTDQLATMNGFVAVPVDSVQPILSYWYQLLLTDVSDKMYVEIQEKGTTGWSNLITYDKSHNHSAYTREELPLDVYKGKEIRVRFRQANAPTVGVRLWALDDLRIDELNAEDYDYPYVNDFESVISVHDDVADIDPNNDVNGQADFNVQALWSFAGAHNGWENHSGQFHLDNNLGEQDLAAHSYYQNATMNGFVQIPIDSVLPSLSYWYQINLNGASYDSVNVRIQEKGSSRWNNLLRYRWHANHNDYTRETISLEAYKGKEVRIRFNQAHDNSTGVRLFNVDDLRIGDFIADNYDYPYINDFESVTSIHDDKLDDDPINDINGQADFNVQGLWSVGGAQTGKTSHSGQYHLDYNSDGLDLFGYRKGQFATMNGFVYIPESSVQPTLSFWYQLSLPGTRDKMTVDVQEAGLLSWTTLASYDLNGNTNEFSYEKVSLEAYKGKEIRLRFVLRYLSSGVPSWTIDDLRIGNLLQSDADGDGIPDAEDPDIDGDGVLNAQDVFPYDPLEWADLDGDGIGDNSDPDRDGDGINNDYEVLLGTDPDNAASVPPDMDSDGIPDSLDDDRDGDGVANNQDLYPDDPARSTFPAVSGLQILLEGTSVRLYWSALTGESAIAGYNVYRSEAPDQSQRTLVNTAPIVDTFLVDSNVSNGTGYYYDVVAVATNGIEGEVAPPVSYFVAYNNISMDGFSAVRVGAQAHLDWVPVSPNITALYPNLAFQIYRSPAGLPSQLLSRADAPPYTDTTGLWNETYDYQMSTVIDFQNPFTGLTETVYGPLTGVQTLQALPPLGLSVDNGVQTAPGQFDLVVENQTNVTVTGLYSEAVGSVGIVAVNGPTTITAQSSDGTFRLSVPVVIASNWILTISEQSVANRTATVSIHMVQDQQGPSVSIEGGVFRSVSTDYIELSGTVIDDYSGITEVYAQSDRFLNQPFQVVQGANGLFSVEVPLEHGNNVINVIAVDSLNNEGSATVTVKRSSTAAPKLQIVSPTPGASFYENNKVTVQGVVYTTLPPEQVKLSMGGQQLFPTEVIDVGAYGFQFNNVTLVEGYNPLTVNVETPAGNDAAVTTVYFSKTAPEPGQEPTPQIVLSSPKGNGYSNDPTVVIAGNVTSTVGVQSLSINNVDVALTGQFSLSKNFQYELDVSTFDEGEITVTLFAMDTIGQTSTVDLVLRRDTAAPTITLNNPNIAQPPAVNRIVEVPYVLQGTISDINLSSFFINNQSVALVPGALAGQYDFNATLVLPQAVNQVISLAAQDLAGNLTSRELIFNADIAVDVEMLSPKQNAEILSGTSGSQVGVIARMSGLSGAETITARIDAEPSQPMTLDGNIAQASLATSILSGQHDVVVEVFDINGNLISAKRTGIRIINSADITLAVERSEPSNMESGADPEEAITIYFNKPIDPVNLVVEVKETVHGHDYDLANQQGVDFTDLKAPELVEVNRDSEIVPGGLAHFPGNRMVSFHANRRYAYDANVFVTVTYLGETLKRFTYHVRPLPTLVTGVARDQDAVPANDIVVEIPELKLSSRTDANGNFNYGFGAQAKDNIKGGRYRIVFNPGLINPQYGTISSWANIQQGRLVNLDPYVVPRINRNIPFVYISSGQANVVLASGNLTMDLSTAQISMPDGQEEGSVHVQMYEMPQLPFPSSDAAMPMWMYGIQPSGIRVEGQVGVRLKMPLINNTLDYVPTDGTLVAMLGFNAEGLIIEPVGVGEVLQNEVVSIGKVDLSNLDYLGYALLDENLHGILNDYRNGVILSIDEFKNRLEDAVAGVRQ